jgi:predicted Fe-Mo cluster-binding NifX family protein
MWAPQTAATETVQWGIFNERQKMKIAISAQGLSSDSPVDMRFGRAKAFVIYDSDHSAYSSIDNEQNLQAAQGAGIQSAAAVVNAGCSALITGHCGPKAFMALAKAGVEVYGTTDSSVKDATEAFLAGKLTKFTGADVEGHW